MRLAFLAFYAFCELLESISCVFSMGPLGSNPTLTAFLESIRLRRCRPPCRGRLTIRRFPTTSDRLGLQVGRSRKVHRLDRIGFLLDQKFQLDSRPGAQFNP